MEQLIPIINKLQDVFTAVGANPISLPQLVVVGSQSSGKSSVIENIVGRDFLPRGTGIVTRRPLILQLVHTPPTTTATSHSHSNSSFSSTTTASSTSSGSSHSSSSSASTPSTITSTSTSVLSHEHDDLYAADVDSPHTPHNNHSTSASSSFASVHPTPFSSSSSSSNAVNGHHSNAITPSTNSSSTSSLSPSTSSSQEEYGIFLHNPHHKYYNFHEIRDEIIIETERLTVDLPGLTKVPVGDQPDDIEQQIRDLLLSFITPTNSIIVAVTSATEDLANSDALKLAKQVDPYGQRTLGVLTKIDLMDRGTDALSILQGHVIQLQYGFIGVINRSQHDIQHNKPISEALKSEKLFFSSHPIYHSIANRLGTSYLTKRLNSILLQHIITVLPELKYKLTTALSDTQQELESYGTTIDPNQTSLGTILLPVISTFVTNFQNALEGHNIDVSRNELYGGARIAYIFRNIFSTHLTTIHPFDTLSDHEIRIAIQNASGTKQSALFIPEISFELLVIKQIERLLQPALQCVDLVIDEMIHVCTQCESIVPNLIRFPTLKQSLQSYVTTLLRSRIEPTKTHIQHLIQCETAYINTTHPDFIGGSRAVSLVMERMSHQHGGGHTSMMNTSSVMNGGMLTSNHANVNGIGSDEKIEVHQQQPQHPTQPHYTSRRSFSIGGGNNHNNNNQNGHVGNGVQHSPDPPLSARAHHTNHPSSYHNSPLHHSQSYSSLLNPPAPNGTASVNGPSSSPLRASVSARSLFHASPHHSHHSHQQHPPVHSHNGHHRRHPSPPTSSPNSHAATAPGTASMFQSLFRSASPPQSPKQKTLPNAAGAGEKQANGMNGGDSGKTNHTTNGARRSSLASTTLANIASAIDKSLITNGIENGDKEGVYDVSPLLSSMSISAPQPPPDAVSIGEHELFSSSHIPLKSFQPTERELIETEVIKLLIESYFSIVKTTIADQIPKTIMFFLVGFIKKHMQSELVKELYKPEAAEYLLREADDIAEKRSACMATLQLLNRSLEILNSVRDFQP